MMESPLSAVRIADIFKPAVEASNHQQGFL